MGVALPSRGQGVLGLRVAVTTVRSELSLPRSLGTSVAGAGRQERGGGGGGGGRGGREGGREGGEGGREEW